MLSFDGTRRRTAPLAIAGGVLAGAVALGATAWWVTMDGDPTPGDSLCASRLTFGGETYSAYGDVLRMPRNGPALGEGTHPRCGEANSRRSEVSALPGLPGAAAVLADGKLWLSKDAEPADLEEYERPVACEGPAQRLRGSFVSLRGPAPADDDVVSPPYTATVRASRGSGLPLDRYAWLVVEVRVTPRTEGGDDARLATDALRGTSEVGLTVACSSDGGFVARRIAVVPVS